MSSLMTILSRIYPADEETRDGLHVAKPCATGWE